MKLSLSRIRSLSSPLRQWPLWLSLAAAGAVGAPSGFSDPEATKLEAEFRAAELASQGQWVELLPGGWSIRYFVAILKREENNGAILAQLRVDYPSATEDGVASVVETTWLYCDEGRQRIIASYEYDAMGKQLSNKQTPDAPQTTLETPYTGQNQLICSGQFLLALVPDGYRRFGDAVRNRRAYRASVTPDRPIPVP